MIESTVDFQYNGDKDDMDVDVDRIVLGVDVLGSYVEVFMKDYDGSCMLDRKVLVNMLQALDDLTTECCADE